MMVKNYYGEEQRGITENNGLKLRKIKCGLDAMIKLHNTKFRMRKRKKYKKW